MPTSKNDMNLGKTSLKFLLIAIAIVTVSLLLAVFIILINGSFTYWAIIPMLVGFPITMLININLARKTIAQMKNEPLEGEALDE